MKEIMKILVERQNCLEKGVIPFVDSGSLEEEMAFNELMYIKKQIGAIVAGLKK